MPRLRLLILCAALAAHGALAAPKYPDRHQFAAIGHTFDNGGESALKQALADSSEPGLAFVVVHGIKSAKEPCSDKLYAQRRALMDEAQRPLIVVPAASDWSACKNSLGRSDAIDRLNRVRELFFNEPTSLGAARLPVTRLSASAKFRSYAENAHWEVGGVLYATLNLPSNNNHYRPEAGRNSEFEDRLVANRFWIKRLFALAKRNRHTALVLFAEGDMQVFSEPTGLRALLTPSVRNDGFEEPRHLVNSLAKNFHGKLLLVDSAPLPAGAEPAIEWQGNIGHLSLGSNAVEVKVTPSAAQPFALKGGLKEKSER